MTLHPRLSRSGIELVKRFEGLRRKAAKLPDGRWTVGYGHTASAREGAEVTPEDAEALLLYDLSRVAMAVEEAVHSPLDENQFAAVTAFAFNVGVDRFRRSDVLKRLNSGAYLQAASAIELWRRADFDGESIVVDALVRRRAAEKLLFLTPMDGFRPAPTPIIRPERDERALGEVADLEAALEGDTTSAVLADAGEDDDSPPALAARGVIERLNAILAADSDQPLEQLEPDPSDPEPPPFPAPIPADEQPQPVETAATLSFSHGAARASPLQLDDQQSDVTTSHRVIETLEPRRGMPRARPVDARLVALGVFGLVLFVASLTTIAFGPATWASLGLGTLGVICMAPGALAMLSGSLLGRER